MAYKHLTQEQRYHLYTMKQMGLSQKQMAIIIHVSESTVSREFKRNSGKQGQYLKNAHRLTLSRRRGKAKVRFSKEDWQLIEDYIQQDFSPEQISLRLKYLKRLCISPEWIYQYIDADKRLGGSLHTHLRCKKKNRKRYGGRPHKSNSICNRVSIDERPKIVDSRRRYGDWEVDTVIGRPGGKVLVTLVERKSKLSLIGLSANKTAQAVKETLLDLLGSFSSYVHTLTYDNGTEFSQHQQIDKALNSQGYFAHPFCSGERGLSENTNGLIRQYLPKRSSFDQKTQSTMQFIMDRLNNRPRKALNGRTPNEVFFSGKRIALAT